MYPYNNNRKVLSRHTPKRTRHALSFIGGNGNSSGPPTQHIFFEKHPRNIFFLFLREFFFTRFWGEAFFFWGTLEGLREVNIWTLGQAHLAISSAGAQPKAPLHGLTIQVDVFPYGVLHSPRPTAGRFNFWTPDPAIPHPRSPVPSPVPLAPASLRIPTRRRDCVTDARRCPSGKPHGCRRPPLRHLLACATPSADPWPRPRLRHRVFPLEGPRRAPRGHCSRPVASTCARPSLDAWPPVSNRRHGCLRLLGLGGMTRRSIWIVSRVLRSFFPPHLGLSCFYLR